MKVSISSQVMAMQTVRETRREVARKKGMSRDQADIFFDHLEAAFDTLCFIQDHRDEFLALLIAKRGRE